MKDSLEILQGTTAFLNGQSGLHDTEERFSKFLIKNNKSIVIIDNLFENAARLSEVAACDNLVLSTTGMFAEQLAPLIDAFEKLQYSPKTVIFIGENTALTFVSIARELKKNCGTKFFFLDIIDFSLREINWI